MKKIAIIIAEKNFRDEEFFETKSILEKQDCKLSVFSNKKGLAIGSFGGEVMVNQDLSELNVSDFDALLFVGGVGAMEYLDNDLSYQLIRKANQENKIVSAICIAPLILLRAGILKQKKATVWSSDLDKSTIKELKEKGAIFVNKKAVSDKNIVTANGPTAIKEFCEEILKCLN